MVEVGGHDLERIARSVAVVVAPGVPPDVPALEAARRAGLDIHAEVDIGFLALRRHPLHRHHRDQRQDDHDLADRPRAVPVRA